MNDQEHAAAGIQPFAAVEAARAIMRRAIDATWPEDAQSREALQEAVWRLADSLATYDQRRVGIIRPLAACREPESGPGAFSKALSVAAVSAASRAEELDRLVSHRPARLAS